MTGEPIDFVLIWVDPSDTKWQKEKEKYSKTRETYNKNNFRYRDWDTLRYWFRGVEKFAPWVRYIYFVTCGHFPEWLNMSHPKLRFVTHQDYIPTKYLPTFSSHTIELNLYRIKNLSENFVYFNDDTFIIRPVREKDYFKNGLPYDSAVLNTIIPTKNGISNICFNNVKSINSYFEKKILIKKNFFKWFNIRYGCKIFRNIIFYPWSKFPGFYDFHLPIAYKKSTFEAVWNQFEEELNNTCSHKFRSEKDVNQWLIRYWRIAMGNFNPQNCRFGIYLDLSSDDKLLSSIIYKKRFKTICLNDYEDINENQFNEKKIKLKLAFEKILPNKSKFEKS